MFFKHRLILATCTGRLHQQPELHAREGQRGGRVRAFSNSSLMGLTKVLDTYSAASLPSSIARAVLGTWQSTTGPPRAREGHPWAWH
jgi:hypothetical protein